MCSACVTHPGISYESRAEGIVSKQKGSRYFGPLTRPAGCNKIPAKCDAITARRPTRRAARRFSVPIQLVREIADRLLHHIRRVLTRSKKNADDSGEHRKDQCDNENGDADFSAHLRVPRRAVALPDGSC
jgi:hypothetical protein